ncbi:hypothetical protein K9N08_04660 [Candidatus Gracilibacteria bacterium]|nr:hypothetical protein [Candidatus Gracilibacteria bacterium]MCF7856797.1 hypothetical protein [Candidatus Gracilibacteria bacterium]MCF7897075.1 hypothetical protein [Candidatus Gracilibacteria bacterium]
MIKRHNLFLGGVIAIVTILAFITIFYVPSLVFKNQKCELNLEDNIFLGVGEQRQIVGFQSDLWVVRITDSKVARISGDQIIAKQKGETKINFSMKDTKSCFFEVNLQVANVSSSSKNMLLKEGIKMNLLESEKNSNIAPLPPTR